MLEGVRAPVWWTQLEQEEEMSTFIDPYSEQCGIRRVVVMVAHPDDETLWSGGLLLSHPAWSTFIVTLCRGQDPDRAPRFRSALDCFKAQGRMGDLDDGPEQVPLPDALVRDTILGLLPGRDYDLLLTHSPVSYTHLTLPTKRIV